MRWVEAKGAGQVKIEGVILIFRAVVGIIILRVKGVDMTEGQLLVEYWYLWAINIIMLVWGYALVAKGPDK